MKRISAIVFTLFLFAPSLSGQPQLIENDFQLLMSRYSNTFEEALTDTINSGNREFPTPRSVLFKSMMIPGWGQIENRQAWKVPIIYAMFAGVGYYTIYLNGEYQDYRAAFYNAVQGEDNDFRFGPTPEHLQGISSNQLQSNRNSLRNQRDFMFVVMGLAYGLNVLDAYVFAHMRSFDVSDDLSARTVIQPGLIAEGSPGITFSLTLQRK